MKGKLIVIEGLDGSGKSTQIEILKQQFELKGIKNKFIHFPMLNKGIYGNIIAEFLRGELGTLDNVHPKLVALLFANDRKEHISIIEKWIDEGYLVLADRYVTSNIAFQCAKIKDDEGKRALKEWIIDLEFNVNQLPKPDKTFYLDMPFNFIKDSLSKNRKGNDRNYLNGQKDIHEASFELQNNVMIEYKKMLRDQLDFINIECSLNNEQILSPKEINQKILGLLSI